MIRLLPVYSYDAGVYQAWLEDEASKGRLLRRSWGAFFAQFDKTEPMAVRYRVEPIGRRDPEPDYGRRMECRAMGWDYVCRLSGEFYLWRSADPSAPEFYTDPQVQAEAYRRMVRRLWLWLVPLVLLWGLLASIPARGGWLFRVLTGSGGGLRLSQGLFCLLASLQCVIQTVSLTRYVRRLRTGLPQPERKPYRGARAVAWVMFSLWLLMAVSLCVQLAQPRSRPFLPEAEFAEEVPYVPLAVIDPGAPSDGAVAIHDRSLLVPDQWWVLEGDLEGDGKPQCDTRTYRIRTALLTGWMARSLLADLARGDAEMAPVDYPGLDGAWAGVYVRSGTPVLVAWRGDRLVWVTCGTQGSLTDHLAEFAALLAGEG